MIGQVSIPHSNKLAIYIRKENFCRLCIWNLETWTCEKIIKAMFPHNLFRRSDGFYILESGIDNATIKMRNLKTLKYNFRLYINKPHYITMSAKAYEKEILIQRYDYNKVEILDLETKEYKTIFFLPGIHVQNAKFTQLHPSSDIDDTFLESLKMHGAIIE